MIDGFLCYAPEMARECVDYPDEGFDVTAAHSEIIDPYRAGLVGPAEC